MSEQMTPEEFFVQWCMDTESSKAEVFVEEDMLEFALAYYQYRASQNEPDEVSDDAPQCPKCGGYLNEEGKCDEPVCASLPEGVEGQALFCPLCGIRIVAGSTDTWIPVPTPPSAEGAE